MDSRRKQTITTKVQK